MSSRHKVKRGRHQMYSSSDASQSSGASDLNEGISELDNESDNSAYSEPSSSETDMQRKSTSKRKSQHCQSEKERKNFKLSSNRLQEKFKTPKKTRNKSKHFTDKEDECLIEDIKISLPGTLGGRHREKVWERLAFSLSQQCPRGEQPPRTAKQCSARWQNMKTKVAKVNRAAKESGNGGSRGPWFTKDVEEILSLEKEKLMQRDTNDSAEGLIDDLKAERDKRLSNTPKHGSEVKEAGGSSPTASTPSIMPTRSPAAHEKQKRQSNTVVTGANDIQRAMSSLSTPLTTISNSLHLMAVTSFVSKYEAMSAPMQAFMLSQLAGRIPIASVAAISTGQANVAAANAALNAPTVGNAIPDCAPAAVAIPPPASTEDVALRGPPAAIVNAAAAVDAPNTAN